MERIPAVYILASQKRGTMYLGVTSNCWVGLSSIAMNRFRDSRRNMASKG
jgi:predicted GIY-YIG superfamily endonuclease